MKVNRINLIFFLFGGVWLSLLSAHLLATGDRELLILTQYLPTPQPFEPCDVCEPNDSWDSACGPLAPGKSYEFFIHCPAKPSDAPDDDRFYIEIETPGIYTVDLTNIPTGSDYSVFLYDENKQLLDECSSDNRGNDPEHATCELEQPGRYYPRVYAWQGCNDCDPYMLTVAYPTPVPTAIPPPTPMPPCNTHIDDFGDTNPDNDLGHPSGWELDPPGCGTITVTYTGFRLQLDYDVASPGCTARYTTALWLNAYPYELLAPQIIGSDREELASTVFGLSDEAGHRMGVKVGDWLNQVATDTWQTVDLPLAAFATAVDTTQLDTLFVEMSEPEGASQGTIYLDSVRLERPLAPLTVDNFNDLADPNALGGGFGIHKDDDPGTVLETVYVADGTYDGSPGSYAISYTLPSGGWALWETDLLGLDASDYAFLTFYIKGADGGEKVNLYLTDRDEETEYVDVEEYAPIVTDWTPIRVPLQDFEGVALTDLTRVKFVFEWEPMTGTVFLDDMRFVADTLLIDSFCDGEWDNSLNSETAFFTSSPSCTAPMTPTLSSGSMRMGYDVTAGSDCFSGYWSRTRLDLNPYRTLAVRVRGERCGQVAAISAETTPIQPDKIKLPDYLPNGITDQWQEARIPLAASYVVTDWTRGDVFVYAFAAFQGASKGTMWWDDVTFETACVPLWVDNFNDENGLNALGGSPDVFTWQAEITSTTSITQAYGDTGAGLALIYDIPRGEYAAWQTDLGNLDLSDYDRLAFNIKGEKGGENPYICLIDGDGRHQFVKIENYANVSTAWQTIIIPLDHFGQLDPTRVCFFAVFIQDPPIDVEGAIFLDNIRFLPSPDCSQVTPNQVFLPLTTMGYRPLYLNPVWDFEADTEGWSYYKTYTPSLAVIDVQTSTFRSRWGNASLAATVNLIGGDASYSKGVAYIDLEKHPPPDVAVPLDLSCKSLSCWLYVPTCGLGDPAEPNYVRLRVKDENKKFERSAYTPVVRNQWFELGLRPSTTAPPGGSMDAGFDPRRIIKVEIEFGTHRQGITYRGKIYLDACGWQEIDPANTAAAEACRPDEGAEITPLLPRLQ